MMLIFSVLVLGPFVFVGFGAVVMIVGVLWSPVAAVLCARAAGKRGLAPWRYAMLGALYSILMIVPWVLLLQRLRGKQIPRRPLALSYWLLYAGIWGCGVIALCFNVTLMMLLAFFDDPGTSSVPFPTRDVAVFALLFCINVLALIVSVHGLVKKWREDHMVGLMTQDSHLLPKSYVMPFAHAIVATALSIAALSLL